MLSFIGKTLLTMVLLPTVFVTCLVLPSLNPFLPYFFFHLFSYLFMLHIYFLLFFIMAQFQFYLGLFSLISCNCRCLSKQVVFHSPLFFTELTYLRLYFSMHAFFFSLSFKGYEYDLFDIFVLDS